MRMKDQRILLKGLKKSAADKVTRIKDYSGLELCDIVAMENNGMEARFKEVMETEDPGEVSQFIKKLADLERFVPQRAS